jgi:molybdenum cofactor guanylyltransferase
VRVAVVVLAGGASRRWGGRDKTSVVLGGRTVLEHALRGLVAGAGIALPDAVIAGPPDHPAALVGGSWVREDPPGGGPVAGLAAALAALDPGVEVAVVGAGDAPFAGEAVPLLLTALQEAAARRDEDPTEADDVDAAIGVDPDGVDQLLLSAYRVRALRRAVADAGVPSGSRVRDVVARLRVIRVPVGARAALDLDTPADLLVAQRLLSGDQGSWRDQGT